MKKSLIALALLTAVFVPVLASAAIFPTGGGNGSIPTGGGNPGTGGGNPGPQVIVLDNPFKVGNDLYTILTYVVNNVLAPIGGVLCVLAFIYAGFKYVIAMGDSTKIKEAHNILKYAAIGTAVLLGAWTITDIISSTISSIVQ